MNNTKLWANRLLGEPVFILGNAPSINNIDLTLLDNFFTIGINKIYLAYEPTILMWQDLVIWEEGYREICKTNSIKYCRKRSINSNRDFYFFNITWEKDTKRLSNRTDLLYGRGITTKITYQFARALGCNPIIFLGTEGKYDKNGDTDFYGKNKHHKKSNPQRFENALKWIIEHNDRDIINCSPKSFAEFFNALSGSSKKSNIKDIIDLPPRTVSFHFQIIEFL